MNLLTNPIVLRMMLVFLLAAMAFAIGAYLMHRLRKDLQRDVDPRQPADAHGFSLAAYHGVIQRLKEQEEELKRLRQEANDRAVASESLSNVVLANLTSGVILFSEAGLVLQANPAARELLGYASPSGLHIRDVFRSVDAVAQEVERALHGGYTVHRLQCQYTTPANASHLLEVTLSPVRMPGQKTGIACLISEVAKPPTT